MVKVEFPEDFKDYLHADKNRAWCTASVHIGDIIIPDVLLVVFEKKG